MFGRLSIFILLLCALASPALAGGQGGGAPIEPAPTLTATRVWYYPESMLQPVLVRSVGETSVERQLVFPGGANRFRIRVETCGGILYAGQPTSWVRIAFRDSQGRLYQLPAHRWRATGGVKDVFFRIPADFPAGSVECRVDVLAGDPAQPAGRSIVSTTGFLRLGRCEL